MAATFAYISRSIYLHISKCYKFTNDVNIIILSNNRRSDNLIRWLLLIVLSTPVWTAPNANKSCIRAHFPVNTSYWNAAFHQRTFLTYAIDRQFNRRDGELSQVLVSQQTTPSLLVLLRTDCAMTYVTFAWCCFRRIRLTTRHMMSKEAVSSSTGSLLSWTWANGISLNTSKACFETCCFVHHY